VTDRLGNWLFAASPTMLHPLWQRFRASPLSVRLAKGVFWSLLGAIVSRAAGVAGSVVVARLLGITAFGEFTMIQSTVGLFGTFAGLGLGITAIKYVAELRESDPTRCGRVIGLILSVATAGGCVCGLMLFMFAPWMATHTLAAPQLAPLLRAGAALVLFSALQGVYSGALGGFEAFKDVARVNWIGAVLGTPLVAVGTYLAGLPGAVVGTVLQLAIGCLLGHFALRKVAARAGVRLNYGLDLSDFRILWRFSLPAFLSAALAGPASWVCNTFLANQPNGFKEVALMNVAGQWRNALIFLPQMTTSVLTPMLANLYGAGKREEFNALLRRNLLFNIALCLALTVPLALGVRVILGWYGPAFLVGTPVFLLTLCGVAVTAGNNLLSRAMQAAGRAWTEMTFSLLWSIVLVGGCFWQVPAHKAVGLAASYLGAFLLLGIWQWCAVRRLFGANASQVANVPAEPQPLSL
jgi:O-antigen/teichoic acid export membrane protein